MKVKQQLIPALLGALLFPPLGFAGHNHTGPQANTHAPIGVMGDHIHKTNEWMLSYRFMTMEMEGNRSGSSSLSANEIATTVPNHFAGQPMQPPTLRVVPTKMTMDMHMFGGMYAPTGNLTVMVMVNYLKKEMDHVTFSGMMGVNRLGNFTTKSEGFGDTKVSGLYSLYNDGNHKVHVNLGLSLPTGSISKKDRVLPLWVCDLNCAYHTACKWVLAPMMCSRVSLISTTKASGIMAHNTWPPLEPVKIVKTIRLVMSIS